MARPAIEDRGTVQDSSIKIRLTKEQHEKLSKAAAAAGCSLSEWARSVLLRAARTGN